MKASEIKIGGVYVAKVSNRLTDVRVDEIREVPGVRRSYGLGLASRITRDRTVYHVTNLATGRKTTFRSAAKFRGVVNK